MDANDLKKFRMRFGFTRKLAAKALGCSVQAIETWENGEAPIPKSVALAVRAFSMGLYSFEVVM